MGEDILDLLLERARSAAFSDDAHRRGWDAVRLAALLRKEGRFDDALGLLDDVVARFGALPDVEAAAYASAVAIHCDAGRPATGVRIGRPIWERSRSAELGTALARAYWELAEETGDPSDRDAWASFGRAFDAAQSAA